MTGPSVGRRDREVWILVPLAVALLVVVAVATLAAWRVAARDLEAFEGQRAELLAESVATRIGSSTPSALALRQLAPAARDVAVVDVQGRVVVATTSPTGALQPGRSSLDLEAGSIVAWAPAGLDRWVRVEVDAARLRTQRRTLRVFSPLVLGVTLATAVLVLLFLRRLLQPWEALLARAREIAGADEPAWIAAAVESALARHRGDLDPITGRAVASSVETGLLVLGPSDEVTATNAAACELLEISEPRVGATLEEVLVGHEGLAAQVREQLADEDSSEVRDVLVGDRAVGVSIHRLARGFGSLVLVSDRTRVRREQDQARLASALAQLGELAAGVAHELRNGLAALAGRLDLLERRREWRQLELARRELGALERVVGDFLAFARPGTARRERVDLNELVRSVVGDRAEFAATRGESAVVCVDGVLLGRALTNLLNNALAASPDGEPVVVEVGRSADHIEVRILDRGPGLPAAVRERLFRPFVTARPGGVGLGLAVARRIVDLHGGALELEDRPGGGTVARVSLLDGGADVTKGSE